MRIFISSIDESGTNRTTRMLLGQCTNTSTIIKQICKQMKLERESTIIKLKHQPYNLIIIDNWPVNHYPIKNGSIFVVQIIENCAPQEYNKSQKEILTKVQQEESYESSQSSSYLHSFFSNTQNSPNSQRSHNYSKYLQDSLRKILQAVRNSNLQKIAQILKEQPQLDDQEQIAKAIEKKYKYLLNQVGQCGRNALHWAIFTKNVEIASFLIIKGSNPTLLTYDEYSPLQLAVINKTPQILTLLLEQKRIDINQITPHKTALHIAVVNDDIKSIEILLQNDVDTEAVDDQGKKAVDITTNPTIKKLLLKKAQIRQVKNPNITKGNVFRVSSMTYRMKERSIIINPFKNDVLIQKMSNQVQDKFQITFIDSIQAIEKQSWLMSSDYYYFKITLRDKDKKELRFGVRHEEIRQKWLFSLRKSMKYRQNIVYIKPVPANQQLIQFLNDQKNQTTLHKRRVEANPQKKMTMSVFDLCPDQDSPISQQKIRQRMELRKSDSRFANFSQKFFMSDNVSNGSQIIMGSIVKNSNSVYGDSSQYASIVQSQVGSSFVDKQLNKYSFRKNQLNKSQYVVSEFKLEDNQTRISFRDFKLIKLLGNGSFGQVYLAKYLNNGNLYALKVLNKKKLINKKQLKYAVSQASILKKVDFPFIINLHFSFQTPLHLYLALDNCTNGDLSQLIIVKQKLSESTSRFIIAQIILALEYLHNNNILYRDLKPENVLLASDGYIRLTDFGLSKQNCFSMSFCGSPAYLSPQMLQKKGVGFSTDIYGIGCVLFQMMTGEPPFFDQNLDILFENIKAGKLRYPSHLSIESKSLISKLLQRDINKRIGCKNFAQIKKHDFFKKLDWNHLQRKKIPPPNEIYLNDQQLHFYPDIQLQKNPQIKLDDMDYDQSAQKISRIKNFTFIRKISSAFGKKKV